MLWKMFAVSSVAVLGVAVVMPTAPWEQHQREMTAKLEQAWQTRHPGPSLPDACDYDDEVRTGEYDLDYTPGNDLVIGNDRLGIAVFSSDTGELVAMSEAVGCRDKQVDWWFNDILQGGETGADRFNGIVMREDVAVGPHGCRTSTWVTLLDVRGDAMKPLLRYRERDFDQCRWLDRTGPTVSREVTHASTRGNHRTVVLRVTERLDPDKPVEYECAFTGTSAWAPGGQPRHDCRALIE